MKGMIKITLSSEAVAEIIRLHMQSLAEDDFDGTIESVSEKGSYSPHDWEVVIGPRAELTALAAVPDLTIEPDPAAA